MAGNFWKSSHYKQWILDKQDLFRQRAKDFQFLTEDEYQKVMIYFTNYIYALALEGNLSHRTQMIATACVFFKRFYAQRSLKDIDPFALSPACLYLANRTEEHDPKYNTTRILNAITAVAKKRPWIPNDFNNNNIRIINEIEFFLLEVLDVCLIVYHPFRTLNILSKDLDEYLKKFLKENPKESLQTVNKDDIFRDAWKTCNDSLRTDVSLLYYPHQIAVAAVMLSVTLNDRENVFKAYFQEIAVDYDAIFEIIKMITQSYKLHVPIIDSEANSKNIQELLAKIPKPAPQLSQMPHI